MKVFGLVFVIAIYAILQTEAIRTEGECMFRVSGSDLGTPQPVYTMNGEYLTPNSSQGVRMRVGERLRISCMGVGRRIMFRNSDTGITDSGEVTCASTDTVSASWLATHTGLNNIHCNISPEETVINIGNCSNNNTLYQIGYDVWTEGFHPLYTVCFDEENLSTLYVMMNQTAANVISQTVIPSPSWIGQDFFPDINMVEVYAEQRHIFDHLIGVERSDIYVTPEQYLITGHVAGLWHFIFEFSQRAAFSYVNSAPHWNTISEGNWDLLQQRITTHFSGAGYNYTVYSGNYGTLRLRNATNDLVDIYLFKDSYDNLRIPVPLYMYKIVYEETEQLGTAFICVNNPNLTPIELAAHTFCKDQCRNDTDSGFDWLSFLDDDLKKGYCFCCDVNQFRETVDHLPHFDVVGIFTGSACNIGFTKLLVFLTLISFVFKYSFGLE